MRYFLSLFIPILSTSLLSMTPAQAATMFRCGNTYQDTPCASQQSAKIVGKTSSPAAQTGATESTVKADADCVEHGDAAKKISWMRETGKTADEQLATAKDGLTRKLIPVVYSQRGSSIQIKSSVEQACMQQKEKDRLAMQLMIEAKRLRGGGQLPDAEAGAGQAKITEQENNQVSTVSLPPENPNKVARCNEYKSQLNSISDARRRGGSMSLMEGLRKRADEIQNQSRALGC